VAFEDINVMADPEARDRLVKLTGQMSIPVIVVDDEVVQGFNKARLKSLLGI
jgi:glutaredoxin 3